MHYYQFNIGDYIKQTVHLSPMEDICYRRLLDMYYETELPIPTETDRVSRRLRLDTGLVNLVLQEFFTLTENGWINARCDAEIVAYHTKLDTARSNGKLGGRPKKTQSVILANPAETGSKAKHKPLNNNQYIKPSSPANAVAFDFKTELLEAGAKPELADDWLAVRKTKKASNTKTALKGFLSEVEKSGFTVNQALVVCCSRSWQGFQAEWVKDMKPVDTTPAIPFDMASYEAQRKADAAAAKERMRQEHAEFLRAQA